MKATINDSRKKDIQIYVSVILEDKR
jgi:hypothetical protein